MNAFPCRLCGSVGDETNGLPFFHMVFCSNKGCPNFKFRVYFTQWQKENVPRGPLHLVPFWAQYPDALIGWRWEGGTVLRLYVHLFFFGFYVERPPLVNL